MKKAFLPIVNSLASRIILGSLPGEASLAAQEYYAFGRNAFWQIMGELVGASPELDYAQRLEILQGAGIALWDVLEKGEREGSLDSAIKSSALVVNDFAAFFRCYPNILRVYFNGKAAQRLFHTHVIKEQTLRDDLEYQVLPSTSPAYAGMPYAQKLAAWRLVMVMVMD